MSIFFSVLCPLGIQTTLNGRSYAQQWHFCNFGKERERTVLTLTHTNTQRMACSSRLGARCIEGCSPNLSQRLIEHP